MCPEPLKLSESASLPILDMKKWPPPNDSFSGGQPLVMSRLRASMIVWTRPANRVSSAFH
ncbi:MAG: hypothetical protein CMJ40_03225 [Phycisphaerae bacterium]|nr:hypothetical protein [Phycisphaerae bacterium]